MQLSKYRQSNIQRKHKFKQTSRVNHSTIPVIDRNGYLSNSMHQISGERSMGSTEIYLREKLPDGTVREMRRRDVSANTDSNGTIEFRGARNNNYRRK